MAPVCGGEGHGTSTTIVVSQHERAHTHTPVLTATTHRWQAGTPQSVPRDWTTDRMKFIAGEQVPM